MHREPVDVTERQGLHRPHASAALIVSAVSVAWTIVGGAAAIALGVQSHTAVLVAFGAIGLVDAVGSIALVHHFRHGLRNDELSDDIERLAHRVVLVGLLLVGTGSIVGGLARLAIDGANEASNVGVALAAVSLVVLSALSFRKLSIAHRIASGALRSDAHLSAIGATQAAVALIGTAFTRWFDWVWADAVTTTIIGGVAVVLAVVTWRAELASRVAVIAN